MFKFIEKRVFGMIFLMMAIVFICANLSFAQSTLYVPSQYSTIQSAINAASNGDTVVVADGTYTGSGNTNIDFFGKAITVKSENGPNNCIIDCQGISGSQGFYLHSGETNSSVIEGFTIQNGNRNISPNNQGGAIWCRNSSPTIKNNIIRNNYGFYGGGICAGKDPSVPTNHIPIITGNIIVQNSASEGGGIYLYYSLAIITNNLILSNNASNGSGIFVQSQSSPKIINNTIVKNTGGSGILCHNNTTPPPEVVNCIIYYNSSSIGNQSPYPAPIVTYSDVEGGYAGTGNINANPLFVDYVNNDFRLQDGSPCISAGTTYLAPSVDILGNPRPTPAGTNPDMGAYEYGSTTPINYPPIANNDYANTMKNVAVTINVLANDSDPNNDVLVIDSVTQPLHGIASIVGSSVVYTPYFNFEGSDSFTYTISDGNGGFATALVSIYIKPYYYCDDFEDGNVSDWIGGYYTGEIDLDCKNPGSPLIQASASAAKSGNYGLLFTKNANNGTSATASSPEFGPIMDPFQVSFDIKLLDNLNHLVWFGETAPFETHEERDNQKFGINFGLGLISLRTPTFPTIGKYYPNEFYHVTIVANPSANIYSLSITGNLLDLNNNPVNILSAQNIPFEFPVRFNGIRRINLYTGSTTIPNSMGFDNLLMGPVQINNPPVAEAGGPYSADEGSPIIFDGSASHDPDSEPLQYRWDFNNDGIWDTNWSSSPTASYTWYDAWTGTAKLEVTDGEASAIDTASVTVNDLVPTAEFTWTPNQQNEGSSVQFTDTSTSFPDNIVSWSWDFGGLGTSTEQNPSYTFNDNGTYTVTLIVTDDDGSTDSVSHDITIIDLVPTAEFTWTPNQQNEGSSVQFTNTSTSFPDNIVSWSWSFGDGGSSTEQNPNHLYIDDGIYNVSLTVTDDDGSTDTVIHAITILNVLPIVFAGENQTANEGATVSFNGSFTDPGINDPHTITWNFGDGSSITGTLAPSHAYGDNGTYIVELIVTDDDGFGRGTLQVVVNNLCPVIGDITAPSDPVMVSTPISASANFTDPGTLDTHIAVWNWGDGNTDTINQAVSPVNGSHTYTSAGVYTVTLTVTDDDGCSDTDIFQYVVIYDPEGGFVTGGGWINSPAGAYTPNPSLTGKATFGFVSKYKKGATVPTGNTQFNFHVAGMNFNSTEYEWLVVANAKAQYKGSGKINGAGDYKFMLTAIDGAIAGGVDKFRIKIIDKATDGIVYDNQMDAPDNAEPTTAISGGNIVIHKEGVASAPTKVSNTPDKTLLLTAYPNPANPEVWIPYQLAEDTDVIIRIYSASGQLVRTLELGHKTAGLYASNSKSAYWDGKNEAGESVKSGVYFYNIQTDKFSATRKIVILK